MVAFAWLAQACGGTTPRVIDVSPPASGRISWAIASRYFSFYATRGQLPCGIYYDAQPGFTGVATFVGAIGGGPAGTSPSGRAFIVSPDGAAGDLYRYRLFIDGHANGDGAMRVSGLEQGGVLSVEVKPDEPAAPKP
jgi:hypothetical protein